MKYKFTTPKLTGKPDAYVLHISVDGTQYKKRISKKFTPKQQKEYAEKLGAKWIELLSKDINPFDIEDKKKHFKITEKITFNEAYKMFQADFIGSPNTLNAYKYKLQDIDNLFGGVHLENVKSDDIENLLKGKIKDGSYAQSTVNQAKKSYTVFFNYCLKKGLIDKSPIVEVPKLKSDKDVDERLNPINDTDFTIIMKKVKELENPNLYYFVNFIYHGCIRPNELRNLKVKDIDFVHKRIKIRASVAKSNKLDYVPIYPALMDIINQMNLKEAEDEDYVFSIDSKSLKKTVYGNRQHRKDFFADWFRAVLKELKLHDNTGYSIYCVKHTSNIHKVNDSWKPAELQKLNRHSSIDQTLAYLAKITKVTEIDNKTSRTI